MKRNTILFVFVILFTSTIYAIGISDNDVKSILKRLDATLSERNEFIKSRQNRIDSLKIKYNDDCDKLDWLDVAMELANEYNSFNNDSALYYYSRGLEHAQKIGLDTVAVKFRLNRAMNLPLAAFIKEAVNEYENIDSVKIPEKLKELYYDAGRQMYSYISSFYRNYPEVYSEWSGKAMECQLNLINCLQPKTPKYLLNQGEYYYLIGEYSKAEAILDELLNIIPEESNLFARASHIISDIAKARGEQNKFIYYLALSAIADTKAATLEVVSLQELGSCLYELDDVQRAYNYSSIALANAVECNASMRTIQTSQAMPIIESAHKAELEASKQRIYFIVIVMAVLLIVLAGTLLFLRWEMRRLSVMRVRLEKANHVKEIYLSQFMNLCSIYMDKLHQFCQLAQRKITNGKVDELLRLTKSGKFVEEQSREFYDVFDNAFLHIYPNFVEGVNSLLKPEEQIVLGDGEKLNTDLRILAFMRLGIEESTRIAQVLNYSVNTIYTYRNKMKNRALNRETFEADVMKISSII